MVVRGRDVCHFVWSASLREELCHAPVHAMNWRAIADACADGCRRIDLGPHGGFQPSRFQEVLGRRNPHPAVGLSAAGRTDLPELNKENRSFALAIALWKRCRWGSAASRDRPSRAGLP
jgi:hypothetical protein